MTGVRGLHHLLYSSPPTPSVSMQDVWGCHFSTYMEIYKSGNNIQMTCQNFDLQCDLLSHMRFVESLSTAVSCLDIVCKSLSINHLRCCEDLPIYVTYMKLFGFKNWQYFHTEVFSAQRLHAHLCGHDFSISFI